MSAWLRLAQTAVEELQAIRALLVALLEQGRSR